MDDTQTISLEVRPTEKANQKPTSDFNEKKRKKEISNVGHQFVNTFKDLSSESGIQKDSADASLRKGDLFSKEVSGTNATIC